MIVETVEEMIARYERLANSAPNKQYGGTYNGFEYGSMTHRKMAELADRIRAQGGTVPNSWERIFNGFDGPGNGFFNGFDRPGNASAQSEALDQMSTDRPPYMKTFHPGSPARGPYQNTVQPQRPINPRYPRDMLRTQTYGPLSNLINGPRPTPRPSISWSQLPLAWKNQLLVGSGQTRNSTSLNNGATMFNSARRPRF